MAFAKLLWVTVPDNAGDPAVLVEEALDRLVGRAIPVFTAPLDEPLHPECHILIEEVK